MMKALKINADYEAQLFYNQKSPEAINQSVEFLFFFLEQKPIFSTKIYSQDYLTYVERITNDRPKIVHTGDFQNHWGALEDLPVERWWNSKITSAEYIISKGLCPDTHLVKTSSDINFSWDKDYLLKDPFGMSGQKFQLLTRDQSTLERESILLKAIEKNPVIVEPWLNRKFDFSQYVFSDGKIIAYHNVVDKKFQYKGTVFNSYPNASLEKLPFYSQMNEHSWRSYQSQIQSIVQFYAQHPNKLGYSIDSFIYEEDGKYKIRTMSEVNYRRTMGRTAYELSLKFGKNRKWSALLMTKAMNSAVPLWETLKPLELKSTSPSGVLVLSPGDSRFDVFFLSADSAQEGRALIEKINALLPDTKLSVDL